MPEVIRVAILSFRVVRHRAVEFYQLAIMVATIRAVMILMEIVVVAVEVVIRTQPRQILVHLWILLHLRIPVVHKTRTVVLWTMLKKKRIGARIVWKMKTVLMLMTLMVRMATS